MHSEQGESGSKTTFSSSLNPSAEGPNCIGLNGATMPNRQHVPVPQSTRSVNCLLPGSDLRPAPPLDNDEVFKKPGKLAGLKKSTTGNYKRGPAKGNFALFETAYEQPIEGSVLIPACILRKKPKIFKLAQRQLSNAGLANPPSDVEGQAFKTPTAPVNKDTMKELEIEAIQNNTSLRIDLCFDDQLFFQPIKGRKGEEKQRRARIFWDCLSLELEANRHALQGNCSVCAEQERHGKVSDARIPSRLAVFFSALRDLVGMLVPDKDKEEILTSFDVERLVRMSRVGSFDPSEFSTWLAQLLMTHCAPLRDGMARQMNQQISDGAKTNDMDLLVKGLETLLSLLENMKLDVANHQVRSFKLLLIADTVPFLQDCFSKMRDDQQIDLKNSQEWFMNARKKYSSQEKSNFDVFISGTLALCESPPKLLPNTFAYDRDRIACLRNDILDLAQLQICTSTFEELVLAHRGRRPTDVEFGEISHRFLQLTSSEDGSSEAITCHVEEIATEIARAVNAMSTGVQSRAPKQTVREFDVQRAMNSLSSRLEEEQCDVIEGIIQDLTERTTHYALLFQKLDSLQMYNAQRIWSTNRSLKSFIPAPDIEDIARRLAHIIVIHWSVWVNIAYLEDDQPNSIANRHPNVCSLESTIEQGARASTKQASELVCHKD